MSETIENEENSFEDVEVENGDDGNSFEMAKNIIRSKYPNLTYLLEFSSCLSIFGQVIFTIMDFFAILIILAFYLHLILLLSVHATKNRANIIFGIIALCTFGLTSTNFILIPLWTFSRFMHFLLNPFEIWMKPLFVLLNLPYEPAQPKEQMFPAFVPYISVCTRVFYSIYAFVYIILFICLLVSNEKGTKGFDIMTLIILIILPCINYMLAILMYCANAFKVLFRCGSIHENCIEDIRNDPFLFSIYYHSTFWDVCGNQDEERSGHDKVDIIWDYLHLICAIYTFIYLAVIFGMGKAGWFGFAFFVIFLIVLTPIQMRVRFPFFFLHTISMSWGCLGCCFAEKCTCFKNCVDVNSENEGNEDEPPKKCFIYRLDEKSEYEQFRKAMLDEKKLPFLDDIKYRTNSHGKIVKDPRYKMAFGSLSIVTYALIIILILIISKSCGDAHFGKPDYQYRQWSNFLNNATNFSLPDFAPPDPTEDILKERVSQMCYVKPFGLKIIQYALLAQLAYVDLTEWENDAIFQSIIKDFFPKNSNVDVTQLKLTDFEKYYGAITLFHFRDLNLKVFSVRGSYSGSDWALDLQLLLSSALLYVASPFTMFLSNSIPNTKKGIRQLMVFPLVLTKSINLVEKYYDTYTEFYDDHYDNESNIVAVGHSLGGGIAKLLGHVRNIQSIAFSGPGVQLLQEYKQSFSKDVHSIMTEADIIPENDVVPHFEISGGTRYQLPCPFGLDCHTIANTLCMIGIVCEIEHPDYCKQLADTSDYQKMFDYIYK